MEETRPQAYLQLIVTLLNCPNGEEPQILQANLELVDSGFLQVCEVVAENLAEEGQENHANFLRNLASQLGQFLGMNDEEDSDHSEGENPQEYLEFIGDLWQAEDSNSNIAVIYLMLNQRQHLLNARFAEILQEGANNLIAQHPEAIESIIGIIENLSIYIRKFPLGKRANNIEIAIAGYHIVLNHRQPRSEKWAQTQNNLANAYSDRIRGEKAQNIEMAIELYNAALEVYTREAFPQDWAMTQNNLAIAYSDRIRGEKAQNIEMAIASYNKALEVCTREAFPQDWAGTQNNLANAYRNRIRGEKAQNIESAIASYNKALEVRTREAFPEKWAMTQNNLATAYFNRIRGEKPKNIEMAIEFYNAALEIYTREVFPQDWAMTQNNLGEAYRNRIKGEKAENIELAIASYHKALEVRTRAAFPQDWAMTQNNLANAYRDRIRGEKAQNIESAIELYHNALTIITREAFPQGHTETLSNLGNLYRSNQQWQLAYDTYAAAIETVELLRGEIQSGDESKQKLAEEYNQIYLGMVEVCIKLQRYTEAIEYVERSKARNLVELFANRDIKPKGNKLFSI